jgi:putative peptide zinc metalloprotease protein
MLDGHRTVAEVWSACNEQLGDYAPTQVEVIQLFGQLYASNLLQAELPPDAEGLLKRYQKRRAREIQGYLTNLLFMRIPLIDPDRFLNRWVGIFGRFFTWYGMAFWVLLLGAGLYSITGRWDELADRSKNILNPNNLMLLYFSIVWVKVFHEFGHCFACKRFGLHEGHTGEVHILGVMLLVFTPLPYMDASSATALRSKWRRMVVGGAGIMVELAIAAVACILWANLQPGSAIRPICYNIMFSAGTWTLLFNGNPLLRFDGYYILSDLLEIPNLHQRSREYLYYLVKKYLWGVRNPRSSAHSAGEKAWFVFFGLASTVYRVFILFRIILFLTDRLPEQFKVIAMGLAGVSAVMWACVPLYKFIRYLATSGELSRVRARAVLTTASFVLAVVFSISQINAPDRVRVEGIVEPVEMAMIYAETDGFLASFQPSGTEVDPGGAPLVTCLNPELLAQHDQLLAERRKLEARQRIARTQEPVAVQILAEQISALDEQIRRVEKNLTNLERHAPLRGTWVAPGIEDGRGRWVRRGDRLALVADLSRVMVRAVADQRSAAMLVSEAEPEVEMRVRGCPTVHLHGRITQILPAGQEQLPSAALGYAAGGEMQIAMDDQRGTQAAEQFFEIHIEPEEGSESKLLSGQRVVVRLSLARKPLLVQWWRSLLQLVQTRLQL